MKYTLIGGHHPLSYALTSTLIKQGHQVSLFFQHHPPPSYFKRDFQNHKVEIFVGDPKSALALLPAVESSDFVIVCLSDPYWNLDQYRSSFSSSSSTSSLRSFATSTDPLYDQEDSSLLHQGFQKTMGQLLNSFRQKKTRADFQLSSPFSNQKETQSSSVLPYSTYSPYPSSSSSSPTSSLSVSKISSSWTSALFHCLSQIQLHAHVFFICSHQSLWHPNLSVPSHDEDDLFHWIKQLTLSPTLTPIHQELSDFSLLHSSLSQLTASPTRLFIYGHPFGNLNLPQHHPSLSLIDAWIAHHLFGKRPPPLQFSKSLNTHLKHILKNRNQTLALIELNHLITLLTESFLTFSFPLNSPYQEHTFFFFNAYNLKINELDLILNLLNGVQNPLKLTQSVSPFDWIKSLFSSSAVRSQENRSHSNQQNSTAFSLLLKAFQSSLLFAWIFPPASSPSFPLFWSHSLNSSLIHKQLDRVIPSLEDALDLYQAQLHL